MIDPLAVVVFIVLLAAIVFALAMAQRLEKKRREEFARQAAALGLVYESPATEDVARAYGPFGVFKSGFDRRGLHLLRGTYQGVEVRLLDYRYKTQHSDGKQQHTETHYVGVALALTGRSQPRLTIVPETIGLKLWDALGGDDIDFESDEFSRRFWVKSDDRRSAYATIDPRMMEFLLTPGWDHWEVAAGVCLHQNGRLRPENAKTILDRLVGFVQRMPSAAVSVGAVA
jgi:hypothetical protein